VRSAVLFCVLALGATGCGGTAPRDSAKEFKGEEQKVAAAVEQIEKAARADKPATVCEKLFTDARLAKLTKQGTNCKTGVKEAFQDAETLDLTVEDVTISGDAATAKITAGSGSNKKTETLELKRDGAAWKIDALKS
jgi:phage tail sheath gpL-like